MGKFIINNLFKNNNINFFIKKIIHDKSQIYN
jgi:hypothetical protein